MTALPARQTIALATLLQRSATPQRPSARVARKPAAPIRPRPPSPPDYASSLTPSDALDPPFALRPIYPPQALILWVQVATCLNCGLIHRYPSASVLIQYAPNEHTLHHKRDDAALAALPPDLPRELKVKECTIPFCEECFL